MPRDVRKYLFDIEQACRLIRSFVAEKSFEHYRADPMLRSAVERQFEIIGEALNQALKIDPGLARGIGHCRRIIGFRNQLIHGYASVSHEVVWGIVETWLPILHQEVKELLED